MLTLMVAYAMQGANQQFGVQGPGQGYFDSVKKSKAGTKTFPVSEQTLCLSFLQGLGTICVFLNIYI